jgi:ppGpp synthetase/RelA/SpoT-type nucleotidyltranferase
MVTSEANKLILDQFDDQKGLYKRLSKKFSTLLKELMLAHGVPVHSIIARRKKRKSLVKKLREKSTEYTKLSDITDIAGVRVITYRAQDVDAVKIIIESEFGIDEENSKDHRIPENYKEFSYTSLHHVAYLKPARSEAFENKSFEGLKVEIQTRSILQHAWAEIEHDSVYKNENKVGPVISRRFARISSLLELADKEFDSIEQQLKQEQELIIRSITEKPETTPLTPLTIETFILNDDITKDLDEALFSYKKSIPQPAIGHLIVGAQKKAVISPDGEMYLHHLKDMNITSIAEARSALESNANLIRSFGVHWLQEQPIPIHWHKEAPSPAGTCIYLLWLYNYRSTKKLKRKDGSPASIPIVLGVWDFFKSEEDLASAIAKTKEDLAK